MVTTWIGWAGTLIVMVVLAAVAGRAQSGSPWAIFIDRRNTWSLTQFQVVLWTFAIFPVIVGAVVGRATINPGTAWDLIIPGELWALMGISLGSTVIAVAIKTMKDDPDGRASGRILTRTGPEKARFFDMMAYDEGAGSLEQLDVTKFQNFLITLALLGTFVWNALWLFSKAGAPGDVTALPTLDPTLVAILTVSHGGYLVAKGLPQSTVPRDDPERPLAKTLFAVHAQRPATTVAEAAPVGSN